MSREYRSSARGTVELVEVWRARNPNFLAALKTTKDINGLRAMFVRLVSGIPNLPLENMGNNPVKINLDGIDYHLMAILGATGLNPMVLWFYLKGMGGYPTTPDLAWDSISAAVLGNTPGRFQTRLSRESLKDWLVDARTMRWFAETLHTFGSQLDSQAIEIFWGNGLELFVAYGTDNMERLTLEMLASAKNQSLHLDAILNSKASTAEGRTLH